MPSSSSHAPENHPNETVTISEVIEKQSQLEDQAAELLPFDITKCSKPAGHIRQSVYSCLTCNPINPAQDHLRAGVCSSCSVSCHTDHHLVELFVRRNFVCDCGTDRCNPGQCCLISHPPGPVDQSSPSEASTLSNRYDKNFDGQFCICERGKTYDPETETEDMYQCLACEDWRHASCLGPHPDPDDWDDLICADCVQNNPTIKSILFKHAGGEGTGMVVCRDFGTDGPDRIVCYGKLPDSNTDSQQERVDGHASPAKGSVEGTAQIEPEKCENVMYSNKKEVQRIDNGSEVRAHGANPTIPIEHSIHRPDAHTKQEAQEPQEPLTDESKDQPKAAENPEQENKRSWSVEGERVVPEKKRSSSATPNHTESACTKKPRLEHDAGDSDDRQGDECRAPFKSPSESILNSIDPGFSNVFLAAGWRTRWCRCHDCLAVLRRLSWLIEEEDDAWEPGEDADSC